MYLPSDRARHHLQARLSPQVTASEVLEMMATRESVSAKELVAIADTEMSVNADVQPAITS